MNDMLSPQSLSFEPPRRDRITAISPAVQRRPIVLVLGMHRSGTSLCSHILSTLGVDMVDEIGVNRGNDKGHWERWEIVEFHDRILRLFNRDYFGRFHDFALPVAWWAEPRVAQIRKEMVAFLERRMGSSYFGFKDPRTVRLMPVWHQILNELKLAPKRVLCLRNPAQIGRSLNAHDGLDREIGEYRWLVHMIDFFRYTTNFDFCTIEYEEWFNNPSSNIEKLQKFLDLQWQQSEADLGLVLSGIIDPGARHDDADHRKADQPLVRTLYTLASRAGQDEARDQIAYIVSQFISFQQLQRPFLQAYEDVAKTAAKYPEIEQQAMALRAAVSERDAAVEAAEGRAGGAEARLAEALAEIEQQRAQIGELARERGEARSLKESLVERETACSDLSRRVDELLSALQAAQAEGAAREAALRCAEQEAQKRDAAAEAMQAEVVTLRDALTQAEREAQERAASEAALQSETAGLRNALAQAEQERAAVAEAMQAQVATLRLRNAMARAAHETQAATAMQAEIATLRDALQARGAAAAAFEAEVVTLRALLAQAEQAGQERAATAAAFEAEVVTLRALLAQAEQAGQERAATAAAEAEIGRLRNAVAQAEREGQERRAAAGAIQGEVLALWDTLAQAHHEVQEHAVAAQAMAAEIARLRDALAQAERKAQESGEGAQRLRAEVVTLRDARAKEERASQERTASEAALQAEIVTLQGALTAARQVGKAAIAAFRIETAAPTAPYGPSRLRRGIMRFFRSGMRCEIRRVGPVQ